jgi:hypothetical protein
MQRESVAISHQMKGTVFPRTPHIAQPRASTRPESTWWVLAFSARLVRKEQTSGPRALL